MVYHLATSHSPIKHADRSTPNPTLQTRKSGIHLGEPCAAQGSERNVLTAPVNENGTRLLFQSGNMIGKRRLRYMQSPSGLRKAGILRQQREFPQIIGVQDASLRPDRYSKPALLATRPPFPFNPQTRTSSVKTPRDAPAFRKSLRPYPQIANSAPFPFPAPFLPLCRSKLAGNEDQSSCIC